MWLKLIVGPECEEYSGDSLKIVMEGPDYEEDSGNSLDIVSKMVETRVRVLKLWIDGLIFVTDSLIWWYFICRAYSLNVQWI